MRGRSLPASCGFGIASDVGCSGDSIEALEYLTRGRSVATSVGFDQPDHLRFQTRTFLYPPDFTPLT